MTVGLCAELHEIVNSDGKAHIRDFYVHYLRDIMYDSQAVVLTYQ
jgi:hypothetical protein